MRPHKTVNLFGFSIADIPETEVASELTQLATSPGDRVKVAFALHIGGLLELHDVEYVEAMTNANVVYADGISAVLLARVAGARNIERSVTTDIGWAVLNSFKTMVGRSGRFALIGGPPGLSTRAREVLEDAKAGTGVYSTHGYHDEWDDVFRGLHSTEPDIVFVGLGAPEEMKWVHRHRDRFPPTLVVTCGGWFGYIIGNERRAPQFMQNWGLEWLYRLWQQPRRLTGRYVRGLVRFPQLLILTAYYRGRMRKRGR